MKINDILLALAANDGRNFKIDLLNQHKGNKVLREVVRLALDPLTQFYIRKIPDYVPNPNKSDVTLAFGLDSLQDLSKRLVTGNAAISHLTSLLEVLNEDDAKVIEKIIQKDLRCGVSVSTANKVWPNLVMDYPCMLCSQYEEKLVDKIKFPAVIDLKNDGMRVNVIVRNGSVEFRSRNGKELDLKGNLVQDFLTLADGHNVVFDGELMVMFDNDYQFADRQTGNGILNKANKGTISDAEAAMVHVVVWDMIPYIDFVNGKCNVPYLTRRETVRKTIDVLNEGKRIWNVWSKIVNNIEEVQDEFQRLLSEGYEGIILKDLNGKWENKRTKSQIKFKGELECDLRIVGIQMGTGKYEGMLGALLCESEDKKIQVSVGSGFNDEHRKTITTDVIGKVVAVKYNARITNKQGEESLFLPIFIEVRDDKDVADSSKDIK